MSMLYDPQKKDSVAKSISLTVTQAVSYYQDLQLHLDSFNIQFIEDIFKRYGYPGKKMVGTPTNEAAWNIIQHSQKIDKYLPIIKKAAEDNELPFYLYGMMLDRQLMSEGKEQLYGSQVTCRTIKTGKNGCFVWPIKDADQVNARRKEAGFTLTVEQNSKRLGVAYSVIKLSDIK